MEATLVPLEGGWSGRTFLATDPAGERTVVRIYPDEIAGRAKVEAALLTLVSGLLPVPAIVEVREPAGAAPGLLITHYVAGLRGDLLLEQADSSVIERFGRDLGAIAATLAGMPTLRAGEFVDQELRVRHGAEWPELEEFVAASLDALGHALGWSDAEALALTSLARQSQQLLDTITRTCVVHSDLNPKNVIADPTTGRVLAVVDWEFAHSGHPYTDLGNLLRLDKQPSYVAGVLAGYRERCPVPSEASLDLASMHDLASAADLYALVELAHRWVTTFGASDDLVTHPGARAVERLTQLVRAEIPQAGV